MSIKKNLINIEKFIKKEHKNEISEYQKNYREEHKDNDEWKEYHKNYAKKWYQDNKDVLYEKHKNITKNIKKNKFNIIRNGKKIIKKKEKNNIGHTVFKNALTQYILLKIIFVLTVH